nr:ribonuclease H-like domain-containing protein [Tanacetum cinerariifolium]
MKMEHYLSHTDYPIWQVIQNGNGPVFITTNTNGIIKVLPPKTAKEVVPREMDRKARERKARTILLMALPEDHLAKFYKMDDAKEMREAIKLRFGGNDKSKKMQKYLLKQQFEGFSVSTSEGLHKGYDMFQTLLSQLEIHGAGVSYEDANQKFLRSLPSSWSQVALIMRTKPGLDTLSFDDLYNNLRVFERDVKGTTTSSSNTHNVAFVSADNTSSTNDVSTAYSVSSPSVSKSQKEGSSSYTDDINNDDMEEMDLKWQVAMISMRIKKFYKRTGRKLQFDTKDHVGFDKTKVECFNCHKIGHFARECRAKGNQYNKRRYVGYNGNKTRDNGGRPAYQDDSKALVTIDGEDIDWSGHVEEDAQNYAMMAYSSSNFGSDNE